MTTSPQLLLAVMSGGVCLKDGLARGLRLAGSQSAFERMLPEPGR